MKRIYSPFHMKNFLENIYNDVLYALEEDYTYEFSFKNRKYIILLEKSKFKSHNETNKKSTKDIYLITLGIEEYDTDNEELVIVQLDQTFCFDNPVEVIIQCASLIEHFYINQLEAYGAI